MERYVFIILNLYGARTDRISITQGMGDDDSESKHKDFLLVNTADATNLVGTQYSDDVVPVASKGTLAAGVTAIYPSSWIDIIDTTQSVAVSFYC